ncbi:MAG: hypothetical protein KY460_13360 [Actinobacteria bacterium]|nr:hypothetical protein [Actinomycetota bacterium]
MSRPHALVVLDFSGTLSVAAARFAAPERLTAELARSGLAALGIDTPDVFWERLVNPTWERGSTTSAGYVTVLTEAAIHLLRERGHHQDPAVVGECVSRFADRYFASSTIAEPWQPWLHRLFAHPDLVMMVATDHYAEVTGHIIAQLAAHGLPAAAVTGAHRAPDAHVIVANSADIGHHKAERSFWDAVARTASAVDPVVTIDDFGANEQQDDAYAAQTRLARRQQETADLLSAVFGASVTALPFALDEDGGADLRHRIDEIGRTTMRVLSGAP